MSRPVVGRVAVAATMTRLPSGVMAMDAGISPSDARTVQTRSPVDVLYATVAIWLAPVDDWLHPVTIALVPSGVTATAVASSDMFPGPSYCLAQSWPPLLLL